MSGIIRAAELREQDPRQIAREAWQTEAALAQAEQALDAAIEAQIRARRLAAAAAGKLADLREHNAQMAGRSHDSIPE